MATVPNVAGWVDDGLAALAVRLQSVFPDVVDHALVDDRARIVISWYITPEQHIVEFVMLNALLVLLLVTLLRSSTLWRIDVPRVPSKPNSADVWRGRLPGDLGSLVDAIFAPARAKGGALLAAADVLFSVLAWVCMGATIYYKTQNGRELYLLQPCHLHNALLLYLTLSRSKTASRWFAFYLCTSYGAVLALATPDTRGLEYWLEMEMFFVQHVMLLALPLIWVIRRRYDLYSSASLVIFTWAAFFELHLNVFLPASLASTWTHGAHGRNINYMMVPPHGPLRWAGKWYRIVMAGVCIGLAFFSSKVLVGIPVWLSGIRHDAEKEAAKLQALQLTHESAAELLVAGAPGALPPAAHSARAAALPSPVASSVSSASALVAAPESLVASSASSASALMAAPDSVASRAPSSGSAASDTESEAASDADEPAPRVLRGASKGRRASLPRNVAALMSELQGSYWDGSADEESSKAPASVRRRRSSVPRAAAAGSAVKARPPARAATPSRKSAEAPPSARKTASRRA